MERTDGNGPPFLLRSGKERLTFWTLGLGQPPGVRSERLRPTPEGVWRAMDPFRSKLAAALVKGVEFPPVRPGSATLYLGAASGTTATHVADAVGREATVYAVEKSLRPFQQLLLVAQRYPNLVPLLEDARFPERYSPWVPRVDLICMDIPQGDQAAILETNLSWFARPGTYVLLAVKLASLPRREGVTARWEEVAPEFSRRMEVEDVTPLDPFHRKHVFVRGRVRGGGGGIPPLTSRGGNRAG